MATITEPNSGEPVLGEVWSNKCREALDQFTRLKLTSLEMPLEGVGLQMVKGVGIIVGNNLSSTITRPMQLFIKYSTDQMTGNTTLKMYLQQVVTPFLGGNYVLKSGYFYLVNTKKAAGIQRLLTNFDNIESEIENLIKEANRFLLMYCKLSTY